MIRFFYHIFIWMILLSVSFPSKAFADEDEMATSIDKIKAVYLIHLSEFTSWSEEKMRLPFFSICISAESELKQPLEEIQGQKIKNKPLKIQLISTASPPNQCHILYVDIFNKTLFEQQKSAPLLTISSEANFLQEGGVIQYYIDNDKVKMRVNLKAMTKAKLSISSKLLRLMNSSP
jgi:hypothetical protein